MDLHTESAKTDATRRSRGFEERDERTPRHKGAPPQAKPCLQDNCLLSKGIHTYTYMYTASKESER